MTQAKKIVLVSKTGYKSCHDSLLQSLIEQKISLFCVVGNDCHKWEEAIDELCVGPKGELEHDLVTTSHPDETVEEVILFAKNWDAGDAVVQVIEV